MNVREVSEEVRSVLLLIVSWGAAFALACRLVPGQPLPSGAKMDSLTIRALGASRAAVGNQLFEVADRTFHKGVGVYRAPAFTGWFVRMGRVIAPQGHTHLEAEAVNEMAPWLYLATKADPHQVEAYVVAAYWLANEGGRPDLAKSVLDEARANNPKDYRVYHEKGRLALKSGALEEAARAFDAAGRLWELDQGSDKVQARTDRSEMLVYRGLLHEEAGELPEALRCYAEVLAFFPGRVGLSERVAELAETGRARVAPSAMWQAIMVKRSHECEREDLDH